MDDLDPTTLAYMCGIFDGEGSVVFDAASGRTVCSLRVGMSCLAILKAFESVFGGSISRNARHTGNKNHYVWHVSGSASEDTARALLEHCVEKAPQLKLYLEARDKCTFSQGKRLSDNEHSLRDHYHNKMKELKH